MVTVIETTADQIPDQIDQFLAHACREEAFQRAILLRPASFRGLRRRIEESFSSGDVEATPEGLDWRTPAQLAKEILHQQQIPVRSELPGGRMVAMETVLQNLSPADPLEEFRREQIQTGTGYASAFVDTIRELEQVGLTAEDCRALDHPRLRDLGMLWARMNDRLQVPNFPSSEVAEQPQIPYAHAMQRVGEEDVSVPASFPPVLGMFDRVTLAEEKLIKKLDDHLRVRLLRPASPLNEREIPWGETRTPDDLFEPDAGTEVSELNRLKSRLFRYATYFDEGADEEPPGDASVRLEQHSVPEEEARAAAQWVLRKLAEGMPPHRVAVLFPDDESIEQTFQFLKQQMEEANRSLDVLGENESTGSIPVQLPAGLPLNEVPRGKQLLLLVRTIEQFLRQEEMVHLLPKLAPEGEDEDSAENGGPSIGLSTSQWRELVFENGMVGGSKARPGEAEKWIEHFTNQITTDEATLREREDNPEDMSYRGERTEKIRRRLRTLKAVKGAVEQLVALCSHIQEEESTSVAQLWEQIKTFCDAYMNLSYRGMDVVEKVDENLSEPLAGEPGEGLSGERAITVFTSLLESITLPVPDADAGVVLAPFQQVAFRAFDAVRFVGLTENTLPEVPREDPILPDALRKQKEFSGKRGTGIGLWTSVEKSRDRLKNLYHLVRSVEEEIVFSCSLRDRDGSRREPSSLFLDIVSASGIRPADDENQSLIPDEDVIQNLMADGRNHHQSRAFPTDAYRQTERGEGDREIRMPTFWFREENPARDFGRSTELVRQGQDTGVFSPLDGDLPDDIPAELIRGLSKEFVLSGSRFKDLALCPHKYLYRRILNFDEPAEPGDTTELSPLVFGSLIHNTAEKMYRLFSDTDVSSREQVEEEIERIKTESWQEVMEENTLVGTDTEERERERFFRTMDNLLKEDKREGRLKRTMEVESRYGYDPDQAVQVGDGLFLGGIIDRIEREGDDMFIRDIKSGSAKTDSNYRIRHDTQLGLYLELLIQSGTTTFEQVQEVSYLYPAYLWQEERAYSKANEESFALTELRDKTQKLLDLGHRLLTNRDFPRTHNEDHCNYCPFKPVCGDEAWDRSREKIQNASPDWAEAFLRRDDLEN